MVIMKFESQKMSKSRNIGAGEFKAKCLKLMDQVQATRESLVVTKHGKPIVSIVPYIERREIPFGCMSEGVVIHGDIVGSLGERWDAEG